MPFLVFKSLKPPPGRFRNCQIFPNSKLADIADIVEVHYIDIYMYGLAHDFGAIVPKKRADIVEVHYIDICTYMVLHMILGQLFPKNGQFKLGYTIHIYRYYSRPNFM